MARKRTQELPPIQTLFSDSWKAFKGSVLNLFILNLIDFVVMLGLIIISVIISLPLGLLAIISSAQVGKLTPTIISSFGALGVLFFIVLLVLFGIGAFFHAANTLFVGKYQSKPAFGKTFKKSFKYVLPLFLLGLISFFIVTGGYFLLIIPGIFFAILFSFAPYEIILNNQGIISSMKRSMNIVLTNFWAIFARMLLWIAIVVAASFISGAFGAKGAGTSGLSFIVNALLGWFGICYHITLYKQATKDFDPKKGTKMLWPFVVGIIGWIVGIIIMVALSSAIFLAISGAIQKGKIKPNSNPSLQTQTLNKSAPSAK